MANIVTKTYDLNIAPGGCRTVVNLSQYENGRLLVFHLVGDSTLSIPSGSTAVIEGTKPDGNVYSGSGTVNVEAGTVTFQETTQMTAAAGEYLAKVKILHGANMVASGNIAMVISADPVSDDAVRSDSDLQGLIAEARETYEGTQNQVDVLESRMDEFTRLPDGSTTGDAELADIRVAADGTIYPTAGDAVRGQVTDLKTAIDYGQESVGAGDEQITGNRVLAFKAGRYRTTGTPFVGAELLFENLENYVCAIFPCSEGDTFTRYSNTSAGLTRAWFFADANMNVISLPSKDTAVINTHIAPANSAFFIVNNSLLLSSVYWAYTGNPLKNTVEAHDTEIDNIYKQIDKFFSGPIQNDYQLYQPTFSLSPSAIENNGVLINTLANTKTTDYIDCSGWTGIKYTGSSWLVCRALAFYDENHAWILSYPATGDTTEYTNEIISIPPNARYVIFADLTSKQAQTLKIEVATEYKIAGKWVGKKWTCVGDSLTEHNLRTDMNYHDYVADSTGISVVNMGRSGTGYMRTYDEGYAFYQRISSVPTDSDVVTIFGSGNDLLYIDSLGTPTDSGLAENPTTICGCINKTIDTLIALMPTVQLGIVAPTPWKGEKPTLDNSNAMGRYVEALRQICYIRSIPFLDLYHESNLRPWTAEGRTACYSKDGTSGVHPDEAGHKIISSRFEGFLNSLLLAS